MVYKGLNELYDMGLVEKKDKPNQVSLFKAEHPNKLENLFESQEKNIQKTDIHSMIFCLIWCLSLI